MSWVHEQNVFNLTHNNSYYGDNRVWQWYHHCCSLISVTTIKECSPRVLRVNSWGFDWKVYVICKYLVNCLLISSIAFSDATWRCREKIFLRKQGCRHEIGVVLIGGLFFLCLSSTTQPKRHPLWHACHYTSIHSVSTATNGIHVSQWEIMPTGIYYLFETSASPAGTYGSSSFRVGY